MQSNLHFTDPKVRMKNDGKDRLVKPILPKTTYQKRAFLLAVCLLLASLASLLWILQKSMPLISKQPDSKYPVSLSSVSHKQVLVADIYQNGKLIQSITLSDVTKTYQFTITGENNASNEIEVRPGSIGIVAASCPDKLCVHQGFLTGSLLPITCLPNRVVIQVREEEPTAHADDLSDAISY